MRILLLGNPSMLHSYLARGLRERGHDIKLVSPGLGWRKFPIYGTLLERRQDINPKLSFIIYLWQTICLMFTCRNYDIVQLCNPIFLEHRTSLLKYFYRFLRRHNNKIILGAYSDDYYYVDQITNHNLLRYSEQNIGDIKRNDAQAQQQRYHWLTDSDCLHGGEQGRFSKFVADDCNHVVACLYEYWAAYNKVMPEKLSFIPLPIEPQQPAITCNKSTGKVRLFIGIQKERSQVKGTDVMLRAAQDIVRDYPDLCTLQVAESVPFTQYQQMINSSDIILDQLYSYTPAMNALISMAKGIVAVSGGEPENYDIINETKLRPIINTYPTYQCVYDALKDIIHHPERLPELKRQSMEYVRRHHDYMKVAEQYENLYLRLLQ